MRLILRLILMFCLLTLPAAPAFAGQKTPAKATAKVLAKSGRSWNGTALPAYPLGTPEVSILRIQIPAGVTLPWHTHPVINAGVLISGELTVITRSGKTLALKAGDPIVEVVDTWHYGKNEGTEPADIIVFYAGVKDEPITVKQ